MNLWKNDSWDLSPPRSAPLGDHDVPLASRTLAGKRVALLVTGGIAAMKAPQLARALRRHGADVTAWASTEALRYVAAEALAWATTRPVVTALTPDAEHLSDAAPFDAYLVAPATYNTINKAALGIADSPLSSGLATALGKLERGLTQVIVAPAMHGHMHNGILTRSLTQLRDMGVQLVRPRDDYGKHNLADNDAIVAAVSRALSRSPLLGVRILVTGGPTPAPIDDVRRIVTRFRGRLGIEIASALHLRGAEVLLVHGDGAVRPPAFVPHVVAHTYGQYRELVHAALRERPVRFGVFSAAVADYEPADVAAGKIPSGQHGRALPLRPTAKVIDEVQAQHPELGLVSFKFEIGTELEKLFSVARERIRRGHLAVVANLGEETSRGAPQAAYLVHGNGAPEQLRGKAEIAERLVRLLEGALSV